MITGTICKDIYYETAASTLTYTISVDGQQIFSGKAYRMPNADFLRININKICQNYVSNDITALLSGPETQITNTNAVKTFTLADKDGNTLETFQFLYCWDNDFNWSGSNVVLSEPINGHYAAGMLKMQSGYSGGSVWTSKVNGNYPTTVKCCDYALIYLNARGGWDAFAIEGTTVKTDVITQYTTDMSYDNTSINFEANRYISEVITNYDFNTGFLTDAEAARLAKHLIGSNRVYIQDLRTNKIIPAIITDTNATYQTYKTNGAKMARYTIKVKESQSKIRK